MTHISSEILQFIYRSKKKKYWVIIIQVSDPFLHMTATSTDFQCIKFIGHIRMVTIRVIFNTKYVQISISTHLLCFSEII
jgi:hypothetical protein